MKTMILSFFFLFTSMFPFFNTELRAQDKKKTIEVATFNFDNFKVRYKFGNEHKMVRLSTAFINGHSTSASYNVSTGSIGAGVGIGVEFPKNVAEKLNLVYGVEFEGNYSFFQQNKQHSMLAGSNAILGIVYNVNQVLQFAAELHPGITYTYTKDVKTTSKTLGFGFNNNLAEFSVGFNF